MIGQMYRICNRSDLKEGTARSFTVGDRAVVLAVERGEVYAFDDICTHDGGDLGEGLIVNGQVECPRHGARFDIRTGAATRMPAIFGIKTHEVKIENDQIYISIGGDQ